MAKVDYKWEFKLKRHSIHFIKFCLKISGVLKASIVHKMQHILMKSHCTIYTCYVSQISYNYNFMCVMAAGHITTQLGNNGGLHGNTTFRLSYAWMPAENK